MKSGLTRYDDKGFYTFSVEDGLPSNWVQNINQHPNGSLILACYNAGVTFYDGKNFSLFNQGLSDKRVMLPPFQMTILFGSQQNLVVLEN